MESDRKWKLGLNSRPYNKISTEIQDLLAQRLTAKGWTRVESLNGSGRRIFIEVLEVSEHVAAFGKNGIDMVANIGVKDTDGRQVYSKAYRGESRSAGMHTWGGMIDLAEKDLAENCFKDEDLVNAVAAPAAR